MTTLGPTRDTSGWPSELFELPNHRLLKSPYAPHETAAVLRCLRGGNTGQKLFNIFKRSYKGSQLSDAIQRALDLETRAQTAGREICDGSVAKK